MRNFPPLYRIIVFFIFHGRNRFSFSQFKLFLHSLLDGTTLLWVRVKIEDVRTLFFCSDGIELFVSLSVVLLIIILQCCSCFTLLFCERIFILSVVFSIVHWIFNTLYVWYGKNRTRIHHSHAYLVNALLRLPTKLYS